MAIALIAFRPFTEINISGTVEDSLGNPLSGVFIVEKGGQGVVYEGTRTDEIGHFSLQPSKKNAVLVFTLVDYEKLEYRIKENENTIHIILRPSVTPLNEVVVIGYSKNKESEADVRYVEPLAGKASGMDLSAPVRHIDKRRYNKASPQSGKKGRRDKRDSDFNTEEYDGIVENRFLSPVENPLSTFSIDVDGGSYSNVRRFLEQGEAPPEGAVRIEELINYFHYEYPQPTGDDPFSINTEIGTCAWSPTHKLVMIGLQGRKIPMESLPPSNLVFLIDVSGSMMEPEKLPLVQRSLKMLVDQLREQDRVSLVVYAGNAGLVMPSTSGADKMKIKDAIDRLEAGGSTAGGAGIQLAYLVAEQNFVKGGNNRVILCTDGDFNVGPSSDSDLERIIEKEKKTGVFLTVLGYGMGNYKDSKMEKLADKGNGNHSYIDNETEARKVLVNEFGGTLFTIAKDVKLQIEFNPAKVQSYRLIGYENRMLNKEDFNNDAKDAGELGSGHTVTALYEIIPVGVKNEFAEKVDLLKYQEKMKPVAQAYANDIMTIKFRYKKPDGETSKLIIYSLPDQIALQTANSANFRFVSAVAEFGMVLKNSEFKQKASFSSAYSIGKNALGTDSEGYRAEFLQLVREAGRIVKQQTASVEDELTGIK